MRRVSEVGIAWYRGNERRASFDVQVSKDGSNWTRVYRGTSSGKKLDMERVSFSGRDARFVRIVGRGNTMNNWNSITEVGLFGRTTQAAAKAATVDQPELTRTEAELQTSEATQPVEPATFELGQNYPNPVQSATTITYNLPRGEHVTLEVYDMAGRRVRTLVSGHQAAGSHDVVWDGRDASGQRMASGGLLLPDRCWLPAPVPDDDAGQVKSADSAKTGDAVGLVPATLPALPLSPLRSRGRGAGFFVPGPDVRLCCRLCIRLWNRAAFCDNFSLTWPPVTAHQNATPRVVI